MDSMVDEGRLASTSQELSLTIAESLFAVILVALITQSGMGHYVDMRSGLGRRR